MSRMRFAHLAEAMRRRPPLTDREQLAVTTPRKSAEVLLVADDPGILAVAELLDREGIRAHAAQSYADALRIIQQTPQCVAVLDATISEQVAFQVYRLLHVESSTPTLLLLSGEAYQQYVFDPHRLALDDFARKPLQADELIHWVHALLVRAGYELPPESTISTLLHADGADEVRNGKLVVVTSAKGGVGKTTLAINLAMGLESLLERKTLLVDADLSFGSVGVLLDIDPGRSIADVSPDSGIGVAELQRALVVHKSGLTVLPRPPTPLAAARLELETVARIILSYRSYFDYVVVDTHPSFDELNIALLDAADRILVVTTPEIAASHNVLGLLMAADSLSYTSKLDLILNRADSGVNKAELASSLHAPVAATIVSAGREVVEAANQGIPILSPGASQRSQIFRDMRRIVELVVSRCEASEATQ